MRMTLTLNAELADITAAVLSRVRTAIASGIPGVADSDVVVSAAAGSVVLTIVVAVPEGVAISSVLSSLRSLVGSAAAASTLLGLTVTTVTEPTAVPTASLSSDEVTPEPAADAAGGGGGMGMVGAAVGAAIVLIAAVVVVRRRQRKGKKDTSSWTRGMASEHSPEAQIVVDTRNGDKLPPPNQLPSHDVGKMLSEQRTPRGERKSHRFEEADEVIEREGPGRESMMFELPKEHRLPPPKGFPTPSRVSQLHTFRPTIPVSLRSDQSAESLLRLAFSAKNRLGAILQGPTQKFTNKSDRELKKKQEVGKDGKKPPRRRPSCADGMSEETRDRPRRQSRLTDPQTQQDVESRACPVPKAAAIVQPRRCPAAPASDLIALRTRPAAHPPPPTADASPAADSSPASPSNPIASPTTGATGSNGSPRPLTTTRLPLGMTSVHV